MKLRIEAKPEELLQKGPQLLMRVADALPCPEAAAVVELLSKGLEPEERALQHPGLRVLHDQMETVYRDQMAKMVSEIQGVIEGRDFAKASTHEPDDAPRRLWLAIDLDGTVLEDLTEDDYAVMTAGEMPPLKDPLPGAQEALTELVNRGCRVSIYTARFSDSMREDEVRGAEIAIHNHLQAWGIPFTDIWVGMKPKADFYVDNKAIRHRTWDRTMERLGVELDGLEKGAPLLRPGKLPPPDPETQKQEREEEHRAEQEAGISKAAKPNFKNLHQVQVGTPGEWGAAAVAYEREAPELFGPDEELHPHDAVSRLSPSEWPGGNEPGSSKLEKRMQTPIGGITPGGYKKVGKDQYEPVGSNHSQEERQKAWLLRGNAGIARIDMPQIKSELVAKFLEELKSDGVNVTREKRMAGELKATQSELHMDKVKKLAKDKGVEQHLRKPVLVSSDGYLLDGHHRWAALTIQDPTNDIPTVKVGMPIKDLLDRARSFEGVEFKKAILDASEAEALAKAYKYIKRWRGPKGEWQYEYPDDARTADRAHANALEDAGPGGGTEPPVYALHVGDEVKVDIPKEIFGEATSAKYYVVAEEGDRVRISRHKDSKYGPSMPRESVKHFINDLSGKVDVPPGSGNEAIDAVAAGKGKLLGKGDDGVVFRVGDQVVKVSTTVPYQPDNEGHRSPAEAREMLKKQVETGNKLIELGVPGLQRSEYVEHGDKGFQVKPYVEIPEKFTKEQLDSVQDTLIAMHEKGYALNDEVQVGLDKDGKPVMFDVGKAAPIQKQSGIFSDVENDMDRLKRLYQQSGVSFVRRDADEGEQAWQRVTGSITREAESASEKRLDVLQQRMQDAAAKRREIARTKFEGEELATELEIIDFDVEDQMFELESARKKLGKSELAKARTHKYTRRIPYTDAKGRRRYRYFYAESSAAREARKGEEIVVGERKVKIENVEEDGTIHYRDEEGKAEKVSPEQWTKMMVAHHGEKYLQWAEKRARSSVAAVFRHVPREMLVDLKGANDREKLADLKKRMPVVYERLRQSFSRAGVSPHAAKRILADTLQRRGWQPEARAHLIGSVLEPGGLHVANNYRSISQGAENLAGGKMVELGHISAAIELSRPSRPGGDYVQDIANLAKSAEMELAKLSEALAKAHEDPTSQATAAVLAQAMAAQAMAKLQLLATAYPGLKDRAVQDVRDAFAEVPSVSPRTKPTREGASTSVFVAGEGGRPKALSGQYKLVEASEVIPSHNPQSFRPNEKYPSDVQERAYHRDPGEQDKVRRNAQRMNPEFVVNTNPDSVNGPPIMTPEGIVLGGNSRTMSMQRIYTDHEEKAAEMRKYLADNAHQFGFTPDDVEALKDPILVRVVEPEEGSQSELQLLVRQMNESFTQAMDPRTMQVAMGRRLSDKTLDSLASAMNDDETLSAFLSSSRAEPFVDALFKAGIIDERNANQYVSKGTKRLNQDGKTYVERILVGRLVENADLLSETRASTVSALARAVPHMVQAEAHGAGYGLRKELQVALDALADISHLADRGSIKMPDAKTSEADFGRIVDQLRSLPGIGEDHPVLSDPRAQTMLKVLVYQGGPRQLTRVFKEYNKLAAQYPEGQQQLIGEKLTPEQVFRHSVEAVINKQAKEEAEAHAAKPAPGQGGLF